MFRIINQEEETYGYGDYKTTNQLGFTEVVEGIAYTILVSGVWKSGLVKIQKVV